MKRWSTFLDILIDLVSELFNIITLGKHYLAIKFFYCHIFTNYKF